MLSKTLLSEVRNDIKNLRMEFGMTANEYLEKNFKMLRETESNELSYDECLDSKYNVSGCYHY